MRRSEEQEEEEEEFVIATKRVKSNKSASALRAVSRLKKRIGYLNQFVFLAFVLIVGLLLSLTWLHL